MPKVSIVIPNYNHAPYLEGRINSVLDQQFTDTEIILLDDCSTDASVEILRGYERHPKVAHLVINKSNSGSTFHQWQRGINLSSGEYIWIAESDDLAAPRFLSRLVMAIDEHPNVGLAYCQSLQINEAGGVVGSWKAQTDAFPGNPWQANFIADGRKLIQSFLLFQNVIPNASAVLFRRRHLMPEVLQEASTYTINGDWFVWSNILLHSDIAFINEHLNACRFHTGKGSIKNIENFNNIAEFYRLRDFFYSSLDIPAAETEELNKSLFSLWMAQRRSFGLQKSAPQILKVLATAESVDASIRTRLFAEPE